MAFLVWRLRFDLRVVPVQELMQRERREGELRGKSREKK